MRTIVTNWTPDSLLTAYHKGMRAATRHDGARIRIDQDTQGGWWLIGSQQCGAIAACYILNSAEFVGEYTR